MSETRVRRPGPRRPGPLILAFAVGLSLLLPLLVVGEINGTLGGIELRLRYKEAFHGLAIAWLILSVCWRMISRLARWSARHSRGMGYSNC